MSEQMYYPQYFDSEKSRNEGRKLPVDEAVTDPTVTEISMALSQIGYDSTIDKNAAHPQEHYTDRGRVFTTTTDSKTDILHAVAAYIPLIRKRTE